MKYRYFLVSLFLIIVNTTLHAANGCTGPNESAAVSSMGKPIVILQSLRVKPSAFLEKNMMYSMLTSMLILTLKNPFQEIMDKNFGWGFGKFELYAFQLNGFYEIAIKDVSTVFNAQNKTVAGTMDCEVDGQEQLTVKKMEHSFLKNWMMTITLNIQFNGHTMSSMMRISINPRFH